MGKRIINILSIKSLALAAGLFVLSFSMCSAKEIDFSSAQQIATTPITYVKEMWHSERGSWAITEDDGSTTTVKDIDIGGAEKICDYLAEAGYTINIPAPDEVKAAYNEGKHISASLDESILPLRNLFNSYDISGNVLDGYTIHIAPKNNLSTTMTVTQYIGKLTVNLPLIDMIYGNNLYKMYSSKTYLGIAVGKYKPDAHNIAESIVDHALHPVMIKDSSGALKKGDATDNTNLVMIEGRGLVTASALSIGPNSITNFKKGGYQGYRFTYPFKVVFTSFDYIEEIPQPESPSEDDGNKTGDPLRSPYWKLHRVR